MFARREDGALEMLFNGTFSAFCTPHVMVQGCIGPVSALAVKSKSVAKTKLDWDKRRVGGCARLRLRRVLRCITRSSINTQILCRTGNRFIYNFVVDTS